MLSEPDNTQDSSPGTDPVPPPDAALLVGASLLSEPDNTQNSSAGTDPVPPPDAALLVGPSMLSNPGTAQNYDDVEILPPLPDITENLNGLSPKGTLPADVGEFPYCKFDGTTPIDKSLKNLKLIFELLQ
jgi:hypothetical protein